MVINTCNIYSDPEYHDTPAYKDGYIEGFSSGYTTVLEYILEDIIESTSEELDDEIESMKRTIDDIRKQSDIHMD